MALDAPRPTARIILHISPEDFASETGKELTAEVLQQLGELANSDFGHQAGYHGWEAAMPPADDDGPEVFMVYVDGDDPVAFATRDLADQYHDAVAMMARVEQQAVVGPTRAAEMIAEERAEEEREARVTCGNCKGEGTVEDSDGQDVVCDKCDGDGEIPNPELEA